MATARANKQHWLSPTGRSLWTLLVFSLLLFLLMIGGAFALPPSICEHPIPPAQSEAELEETDLDMTGTPITSLVGVSRSRKSKGGVSPTPSDASLLLLKASTLPNSLQLVSAVPVGAISQRSGAGISMRC
jgi:hypothetical protein